jgi:hypothetical protein
MRTRVQVAAAAVLVAGVVGGCSQTVPGTVAMTTEPGASTSTRESSPSRSPRTTTPGTPGAPGVAQSITCGEFMELSAEEQVAVIGEIFGNYGDMVGTEEMDTMRMAADAMCQFLPKDIALNDILLGGSPP